MVFVYLGNPLNRLCDRFPLLRQCQPRHWCLQRKPVPQGGAKTCFNTAFCNLKHINMVFVYLGNPLNRLCDRFPLLRQCQPRHWCLQRKPVPQSGAITCSQTRAANGWVFWFRKNMLGSFAQWGLIAKPMNSEPDQSSFCRPTTKLRWLPSTLVTKGIGKSWELWSLKEMWQSTEVHLMTSSRNTKWPWKSWMNLQRESNLGSQRHCGLGTWHCRNHFSLLPSWKFLLAIVATWSGPTLAWMTLWFRIRRSQALLRYSYHKL